MIDTRRVSRRVSLPVALLPLAAVLWIACRDAGRITGPQDDGSLLVVSDPLVAPPGTLGGLGTVRNVVDAATAHIAYVSLPPGTLGDATSATVRNVGRNAQLTVAVMDGGFDPVAIVAEAVVRAERRQAVLLQGFYCRSGCTLLSHMFCPLVAFLFAHAVTFEQGACIIAECKFFRFPEPGL